MSRLYILLGLLLLLSCAVFAQESGIKESGESGSGAPESAEEPVDEPAEEPATEPNDNAKEPANEPAEEPATEPEEPQEEPDDEHGSGHDDGKSGDESGDHDHDHDHDHDGSGEGGSCDLTAWPDVGLRCGPCKILTMWDTFDTRYGNTCKGYCEAAGTTCVGAWEDLSNDCESESTESCDTFSKITGDAICECAPRKGAPLPKDQSSPPFTLEYDGLEADFPKKIADKLYVKPNQIEIMEFVAGAAKIRTQANKVTFKVVKLTAAQATAIVDMVTKKVKGGDFADIGIPEQTVEVKAAAGAQEPEHEISGSGETDASVRTSVSWMMALMVLAAQMVVSM